MEYGQQTVLHVETLALLLRGVGIDGMMTHYNHPVFLGILQGLVEPGELSLHVLLAGIGIFGRGLAVRVDERSGVEEHHAKGGSLVVEHLGVIFLSHHPAAAHLAVVHESLCVATILMVAANGEPVEHQFGMRVNPFVIGEPQWVLGGSHSVEMMNVACCNHALRTYHVGHLAHQFGNGFLVVIAVAAHVVGHVECDFALQFLPFCSIRLPVRILLNGGRRTLRAGGYCRVLSLCCQAAAQQ